jgi:hypothetical protein
MRNPDKKMALRFYNTVPSPTVHGNQIPDSKVNS